MNTIRKEDTFKLLLEKLFLEHFSYDNLISLVEDFEDNGDSIQLAQDFAEELSLYENDIETIFEQNIFDIDPDTLHISFNKPLLENISAALEQIRALTAIDFEKLCTLYLEFLGTTSKPNVTKISHDQGIDFVGLVEKKEGSRILSSSSNVNKIYLIGQAKHYEKDKVKSSEIRELAGSIYLLKTRGFALKNDPYSGIKIHSFTPVHVYFITSYYFSEAAKRLCLNTDIIPVDRILLALTFGLSSKYQDNKGAFSKEALANAIENVNYF